MGMPPDLDLFDAGRVKGKGALHADAMGGDAPHRKVGVGSSSLADAHNGAAHQLDALPLALDDAEVDLYVVAHPESGQVRLEAKVRLGLLFFYRSQ